MSKIKTDAAQLENRLQSDKKLSDHDKAVFYSDWTYSAVRQLTALPNTQSLDQLASYLKLPKKKVKSVIDFLLQTGLCIEKNGKINIGPSSTHLGASSPWVRTHHINWRQKAIENLNAEDVAQLNYTCPMTLSKNDALKIREMIVSFLEQVDKVIEPSPSEQTYCMNIDWFTF